MAKQLFKPPREKFEINADIFFLENSWIWGRRVVQYWKYIFHISISMSASFENFIDHQKNHILYRNLVTQKYLAARTLWLWHLSSCDGSKSTSYIHLSCKMCHKEGRTNMVIPGVRFVCQVSNQFLDSMASLLNPPFVLCVGLLPAREAIGPIFLSRVRPLPLSYFSSALFIISLVSIVCQNRQTFSFPSRRQNSNIFQ